MPQVACAISPLTILCDADNCCLIDRVNIEARFVPAGEISKGLFELENRHGWWSHRRFCTSILSYFHMARIRAPTSIRICSALRSEAAAETFSQVVVSKNCSSVVGMNRVLAA